MAPPIVNAPAPNLPYFTPAQIPPSGTAFDPQPDGRPIPKLFQPIKIRGVEFHNRIFLSPLCQYSADNGKLTLWQTAHLGGIFTRGPGLTIIEATAVAANGRITPEDVGLWSDEQISPLRDLVAFAHSQGQKIGIQLAHAGRKASTVAPWLSFSATASAETGGWPDDVWAPSAVPFVDTFPHPKELTLEGVKAIVGAWVAAARRAVAAGVDVIEIHNAHGYLLHEFLSPVSNKRTDEYGGSFENRTRLTLEIVDGIRAIIPQSTPLFLRISATDWVEETLPDEPSWRIEDTIKFSGILAEHGVDLIDVSSGGVSRFQKIGRGIGPLTNEIAYQAHLSEAVRTAHNENKHLFVGAVGGINTGKVAEGVLEKGQADVVFVGRQFQKDPATVWTFAEQLGVKVKVAHQIEWGFVGRGSSRKAKQVKENRIDDERPVPKSKV